MSRNLNQLNKFQKIAEDLVQDNSEYIIYLSQTEDILVYFTATVYLMERYEFVDVSVDIGYTSLKIQLIICMQQFANIWLKLCLYLQLDIDV